ncbi:MAG: hypothetical protein R3F59_06490 [Myxococcota bacterium]
MNRRQGTWVRAVVAGAAWAWAASAAAAELPDELREVVAEAARADLPPDGLELKAQEGIAKGVPVDRIRGALQVEIDAMRTAQEAVPTLPKQALPAAGRAVRAGVNAQTLATLGGTHDPARAYDAAADLVTTGMPEPDAVRLVVVAAGGASPEASLSGLATAVSALLRNGRTPAWVVERLEQIMAQGGSPLSALPELPAQAAAAADKAKGNAGGNDKSKGKAPGGGGPPTWAGGGNKP